MQILEVRDTTYQKQPRILRVSLAEFSAKLAQDDSWGYEAKFRGGIPGWGTGRGAWSDWDG